jgi:hypothetical protein
MGTFGIEFILILRNDSKWDLERQYRRQRR